MNSKAVLQQIKNSAMYVYVFFCSLFVSLFAVSSPLQSGYIGDSAVFVYVARVIIDGGMPYRDTFDHKGPLIYLIDALGLLIDEKIGIWLLEVLTIYIIFYYTYKIIRLLNFNIHNSCLLIAVGILIFLPYFQGGNFTEEYACAFISVSFYYFLRFFILGDITIHHMIVCGASFASVCMLRVNMTILWIVMCIGILIKLESKGKKESIVRLAKWFAIGIIFVVFPILLWLYINYAFNAFVDNYIIFNLMYSSDPKMASSYNIYEAIKYFILNPAMLISIMTLFYFCVKKNKIKDWLCLCSLLLSITMSCISGRQSLHYGMIFYPFIMYAFARLFSGYAFQTTFESTLGKHIKTVIMLGIFVSLFTVGYYCLIYWINFVNEAFKEERQISNLINSITAETDKISVCGNDNTIYILSDKKSASKYSYQFPIASVDSKIWQEYFQDISNLKAKVIVVLPGVQNKYPYKNIMTIIEEHYTLIGKNRETEVYLLKSVK